MKNLRKFTVFGCFSPFLHVLFGDKTLETVITSVDKCLSNFKKTDPTQSRFEPYWSICCVSLRML